MYRLVERTTPPPHGRRSAKAFFSRPYVESRSRRLRRRGASAVELAVAAPVLFLLVFGVIEFGRMVMVQQALTNAAREGSRMAALATTLNPVDAETACREYLGGVIPDAANPSAVAVSVNPSSFTGITPGTTITVDTSVSFTDVSWLPNNFLNLSSGLVLRGQSTQRRE